MLYLMSASRANRYQVIKLIKKKKKTKQRKTSLSDPAQRFSTRSLHLPDFSTMGRRVLSELQRIGSRVEEGRGIIA